MRVEPEASNGTDGSCTSVGGAGVDGTGSGA